MSKKNNEETINSNKQASESINDELDRVLKLTMFVLVVSPILVYLIITFFDLIVRGNDLYDFVQGDRNTWIGFAGSLIGGAMTMMALLFTIRFEEKKRKADKEANDLLYKEDKASSYLPIFEIKSINKVSGKLELKISSITEKPLRDFALVDQEFGDNTLVNFLFTLEDVPLIANRGEYSVFLDVIYGNLPKESSSIPFLTKLYFQYSDALLVKRYTHKCQLFICFEKDDSPEGHKFYVMEDIKNYPIFESHFYMQGEYPAFLDLE